MCRENVNRKTAILVFLPVCKSSALSSTGLTINLAEDFTFVKVIPLIVVSWDIPEIRYLQPSSKRKSASKKNRSIFDFLVVVVAVDDWPNQHLTVVFVLDEILLSESVNFW